MFGRFLVLVMDVGGYVACMDRYTADNEGTFQQSGVASDILSISRISPNVALSTVMVLT